MRVRRIWPAALLALAPALAACDGSGFDPQAVDDSSTTPSAPKSAASTSAPPEPTDTATPTAPTSEATSSAPPKPIPAACDLVDAAQLNQRFGMPFGTGKPSPDRTGCSFTAPGEATANVVIGKPDACVPPSEDGTIVEPLTEVAGATKAWWVVSDAPPLRSILHSCTARATLDIHVSYEGPYENDPRNDAIALAEQLLPELA
jgi:hypothetical protein